MSASEKLKALDGAATGAPWEATKSRTQRGAGEARYLASWVGDERFTTLTRSEEDAALIASLRNALPQIVAVVEAAEKISLRESLEVTGSDRLADEATAALSALDEALS